MRIREIGEMLDSGGTGGGTLRGGPECAGYWATYQATTEDGEQVEITCTHEWDTDGDLAHESCLTEDGEEATGEAVQRLMDGLLLEYAAHDDYADAVRMLRRRAGLTQEQAGEAIGVERNTITRWECRLSTPHDLTARAALRCLIEAGS